MPPLYYPQRNSFLDYAKLGASLYGIKQQGDIARGQQDVARERTKVMEHQADISGRLADLKSREFDAEFGIALDGETASLLLEKVRDAAVELKRPLFDKELMLLYREIGE